MKKQFLTCALILFSVLLTSAVPYQKTDSNPGIEFASHIQSAPIQAVEFQFQNVELNCFSFELISPAEATNYEKSIPIDAEKEKLILTPLYSWRSMKSPYIKDSQKFNGLVSSSNRFLESKLNC